MAARYQVGWQRLIPFIGYHHVLMMLLAVVIIVFSIILAGCTSSNSLTNVYLLSISYLNSTTAPEPNPAQVNTNASTTFSNLTNANNGTHLEVRAGYMGLCISQNVGVWLCSGSATALANLVKAQGVAVSGGDPLNLIWIASKFRNEIVFNGLIFTAIPLAFITILLLATFPGWHVEEDDEGSEREVKPFPSRPVSQAALAIVAVSSIFMFVSVFWQHIASSTGATMVQTLSYGTVKGHVGLAAMILGWVGVLLSLIVTVGLLVMILSIRILSESFG
ncbi:hypothetical protein PVAG01_07586 [Phlyctema vagabunda]|uniref:Membrane fusion mating protein FIG1 n=1 Tax=Phlyctema vagabunda TaxID=108571 RepID=A0ABR4PCU1_9HELO